MLRRTADTMPAGIARQSASASAAPDSSNVAGIRSITRSKAGSPCRIDWPKSPRSAPARNRPYCTKKGSLKPIALRNFATSSSARVGRQQHERGIAREKQDAEHDERDAEQHEQRLQESPEEVDLHARRRRATASMCGVCGNMSTGCTHSST